MRAAPLKRGKGFTTRSAPLARTGELKRVPLKSGEPKRSAPRDTGAPPNARVTELERDGYTHIPAWLSGYAKSRIEIQHNGCWHWTGSVDSRGYGVANLPAGRRDAAHRYVYKQVHDGIPEAKHLDHQCHNRDAACAGGTPCLHRRCVNPSHVEPATPRENVRRGKTPPALNLAKEKCIRGHDFDRTDSRGWRKCSKCSLKTQAAKRRAAGIPERKVWQSHCANGHEFTAETTRWSKGNRYCKTCDSVKSRSTALLKRKPCKQCGAPKEQGAAYRYCAACRQERRSMPRSRRNTGPSARVRKLVLERDGFACVCCGRSVIGQPYSLQHRDSRGMGGSSDPAKNSPENLLTFLGTATTLCHGRVESRRDPEDNAKGYWLRMGESPLTTPVMVFSPGGSGVTAWPTSDGRYVFEAPAERAS